MNKKENTQPNSLVLTGFPKEHEDAVEFALKALTENLLNLQIHTDWTKTEREDGTVNFKLRYFEDESKTTVKEYSGLEEKKEQSDEEYVTKEEFDKCIKILIEMLDRKQNAPPNIVSPFVNKPLSERTCWVCNLTIDKPMGYVCNHQLCPSRVTCAVQNTGAVSGYAESTAKVKYD